jgi:aspartyl/asparaginyl beta-hydroxylase (cupin superfamily)
MTTNRHRIRTRIRRTATLATTAAAIALTAGLLTACDPTDPSDTSNSLNCLQNWNTISDSLRAIHDNESIAKIDADSDNTKVDKAVDNLNKAISDYNKSILNGDTNPDSSKIDSAASELKNVCTS